MSHFPIKYWISLGLLFYGVLVNAQVNDSTKNWDNQLYFSNKVAGILGDWRLSGEFQVRLEDNWKNLDRTFFEGVATYMYSEHIEIVPDIRITIKPSQVEYRPGLGFIYKILKTNFQLVNQLKWQADINPSSFKNNAIRYALFYNYKVNDNLLVTLVGGALYKWTEDFNGFSFVRFGPGMAYVINDQQTINFSYLLSTINNSAHWEWAGIPFIQLIINVNKHNKYIPAKYISF